MDFISPPDFSVILPKYGYNDIFELSKKARLLFNKAEILSVKEGLRPAALVQFNRMEIDKALTNVFEENLVFVPTYNASSSTSGFSHTAKVADENDINSIIHGVVARDNNTAKELRRQILNKINRIPSHKEIGKLLGYPNCCIEKFLEYDNFDPIYEITKFSSQPFNPLLYQHLRYWGLRTIPWFPCSYNCEESSRLSKSWVDLMESIDEISTNKLIDILSQPCTWSNLYSQIIVKHPYFMGYATSYHTKKELSINFQHGRSL